MTRAAGKAAALQKPRVILALLLLLALTSVMLLDGYLRAEVGGDERVRSNASSSKVPDKVLDGGPILSFRGGEAQSQSVPEKTIALTFDDGPNPTWTPQILKILEANDVPGTFFVVGSMVSRYPSIVKDLVDQGNEIGIHTFTHVDLSYQSDDRIAREMDQTQLALAGAAGITTTLFRAPYSSEADAIDNYSWPVYKKLGEEGYTSVFVDTDSDDWKRPGVSKIIKWATPSKNKGASVLFHDAGGERSQTVKALGTYIKKMKAKGYTFTTISGAIREGTASANPEAARTGPARRPATDAQRDGQSGQQPGRASRRAVRPPAPNRARQPANSRGRTVSWSVGPGRGSQQSPGRPPHRHRHHPLRRQGPRRGRRRRRVDRTGARDRARRRRRRRHGPLRDDADPRPQALPAAQQTPVQLGAGHHPPRERDRARVQREGVHRQHP